MSAESLTLPLRRRSPPLPGQAFANDPDPPIRRIRARRSQESPNNGRVTKGESRECRYRLRRAAPQGKPPCGSALALC